ncbi:MAG TPA: efflux RND transporter periplasmic adaptor subunit [Methylocella sp.]|nr:efflux RND transporter periplasmic adaptor subunit [Methylocella sp.]
MDKKADINGLRSILKKDRVPRLRVLSRSRLVALFVVLIAAALAFYLRQPDAPKPADATADSARPIPVVVAGASIGDFDVTLPALGTVTPIATVAVAAEVSGKLVKIFYEEGQMVKAGDVLAEIDPRPFENTLHQAEGQLLRDQALLDNARIDLQRYRLLVSQSSAPRQQLDTQESLVHQDEGTVKIDQALVDSARLNLDYCRIKAPVTGRVGLRLVDLGNYVTSGGANGIAVITQLQPITVVFPVAEDFLPGVMKQLMAGKTLPVSAYDRGGAALLAQGTLKTVDNQVDPTTGTVKFKAEFANADLSLFPSQFVNVHLSAETLHDATIVPAAAVQYGPKGTFVYEVLADDTVAMRPVTVRAEEGGKAAISGGLSKGVRIVTDGSDRLRDGATVKSSEER